MDTWHRAGSYQTVVLSSRGHPHALNVAEYVGWMPPIANESVANVLAGIG
jgi:hypothetical protein